MITLKDYIAEKVLSYWIYTALTIRGKKLNERKLIEKYGDTVIAYDNEIERIRELIKEAISIGREAMKDKDHICTSISSDLERCIVNDIDFTDWIVDEDPVTGLKEWKRCPCYTETGVYYSVNLFEVDDEYYAVIIQPLSEFLSDWERTIRDDLNMLSRAGIRGILDTIREEMVSDDYEKIKRIYEIKDEIEKIIDIVENRVSKIVLGIPRSSACMVDWVESEFKVGERERETDFLEREFIESMEKRIEEEYKKNNNYSE